MPSQQDRRRLWRHISLICIAITLVLWIIGAVTPLGGSVTYLFHISMFFGLWAVISAYRSDD